tara:strand:- start:5923 stop:6699 length:777 start_codon:yes stop_codon:yes gene_type:complete
MKHLELFSGTHSFGKISSKLGYDVISLDRDLGAECPFGSGYVSKNHIKTDIMTWNYKQYPKGHFHIVTASPVCLWWSLLRHCRKGSFDKKLGRKLTAEDIENDIIELGIPMVEKVFEIIDYFEPKYYIIENPQTGRMKEYINDLIPFIDIDYCKYGLPYQKRTRFWTNIEIEGKLCNKDCDQIITIPNESQDYCKNRQNMKRIKTERKLHKGVIGFTKQKAIKRHRLQLGHVDGGNKKLNRYRVPYKLIEEFFSKIKS